MIYKIGQLWSWSLICHNWTTFSPVIITISEKLPPFWNSLFFWIFCFFGFFFQDKRLFNSLITLSDYNWTEWSLKNKAANHIWENCNGYDLWEYGNCKSRFCCTVARTTLKTSSNIRSLLHELKCNFSLQVFCILHIQYTQFMQVLLYRRKNNMENFLLTSEVSCRVKV